MGYRDENRVGVIVTRFITARAKPNTISAADISLNRRRSDCITQVKRQLHLISFVVYSIQVSSTAHSDMHELAEAGSIQLPNT
jgi:hypothetical protein